MSGEGCCPVDLAVAVDGTILRRGLVSSRAPRPTIEELQNGNLVVVTFDPGVKFDGIFTIHNRCLGPAPP